MPPLGSEFFQFHAVFGKFGKIICWHPTGELAPLPQGNPGSSTGILYALIPVTTMVMTLRPQNLGASFYL